MAKPDQVRALYRTTTRRLVWLTWSKFFHRDSRPIDGLSDPHWPVHCFVHNATFQGFQLRPERAEMLVVDEASMLSIPQMLWLVKHRERERFQNSSGWR